MQGADEATHALVLAHSDLAEVVSQGQDEIYSGLLFTVAKKLLDFLQASSPGETGAQTCVRKLVASVGSRAVDVWHQVAPLRDMIRAHRTVFQILKVLLHYARASFFVPCDIMLRSKASASVCKHGWGTKAV